MSQATREPRGVKGAIPPYREPTPETYETYRYPSGPEKSYLVTEREPSRADVTLVKPEPSVRRQLAQERYARIQRLRERIGEARERLVGVQERAYEIQTTLFGLRPSLAYRELEKQEEYKWLAHFALEKKPQAIYLHQVMGYSFEEMAIREAKQAGWFEAEVKAHYGVAEPVTLEDLVTIASLGMTVYGFAKLGYAASKMAAAKVAESPRWIGSPVDKFLIRHSKRYAEYMSRSLAPQIVTTQQIAPGVPYSFGEMKASAEAIELAFTPKTSLVTISKVPEYAVRTKSLPHLFAKKGTIWKGYLAELGFKTPQLSGLFSEEVTKTTVVTYPPLRQLPYTPFLEPTRKALPSLFLPILPVLKPTAKPLAKPQLLTRQKTSPLTALKPYTILEPKAYPTTTLKPLAIPRVTTRAALEPKQLTRTIQTLSQIARTTGKRATKLESPFEVWQPPKPKIKARKKKRKGYEWRYRVHGVAEPEDILRSLMDIVK